jgi:ABC-2 type transport system ATP-binding protein
MARLFMNVRRLHFVHVWNHYGVQAHSMLGSHAGRNVNSPLTWFKRNPQPRPRRTSVASAQTPVVYYRYRQHAITHHEILPSVSALAIEVDGLTKIFGEATHALRGVSFSVPAGTVCGVLGHNGAGKTTTINILSTLIRPNSGHALVNGYDIVRQAAEVRSSIGMAGQFSAMDPLLNGRENLVLFGRLRGLNRRQAKARADELIEHFDLVDAADRRASTYSGGMRRRVDLAIALVVLPEVLFLDEPSIGLDPRSRRTLWALVNSMARQGITVLLTTQNLEEADLLSDSVVVIDQGQVIANGTAEDLKRRAGTGYCQVTPLNPADLSQVATALTGLHGIDVDADTNSVSVMAPDGVGTLSEVFRRVDALGIELTDISLRKPSLDEAFLHITDRTVAQS